MNSTSTVKVPTSVPQSLMIRFCGPCCSTGLPYTLFPRFSDGTDFVWNPTQAISASVWSGRFLDPPCPLPAVYLNLIVLNNLPEYTWTWPSVTSSVINTIPVPTGYLTLYGLMTAIYNSSQSLISPAQYSDITGTSCVGSATLTVALALNTLYSSYQTVPQFCGVSVESQNILRVNCG